MLRRFVIKTFDNAVPFILFKALKYQLKINLNDMDVSNSQKFTDILDRYQQMEKVRK